jgi:Na+-transporting methylmalonyl-CoA/oxaloacetate decarboxylase gamma subunit
LRNPDTLLNSGFLREDNAMDNFTFGVTMMICGMGGTILTLYILSLIMRLLGKLFPEKKEVK